MVTRFSFLCGLLLAALLFPAAARAQVLGNNDLDLILIADREGGGADDAIDVFRPDSGAFFNNAFLLPGSTNQLEAITDSNTPGIAYAINTVGELYEINYERGTTALIADLDPPGGDDDLTYSSITNLPGSNELYILRTGGGTDDIDTFNVDTGVYTTRVLQSVNTGTIEISDGPASAFGSVNTGGEPAIYSLATGGSYELYDPTPPGSGTTASDRVVLSAGQVNGGSNLLGITNTGASSAINEMIVFEDSAFGSGQDNAYRFSSNSAARNGTSVGTTGGGGGIAVTDVGPSNDDAIVTVATGGAVSVIDDVDVGGGTVSDFTGPVGGGQYRDVTNASASPTGFIFIADDGGSEHIDAYNTAGFSSSAPNNGIFQYDNVYQSAPGGATDTAAGPFTDVSITDAQVPDGAGGSDPFLFQLHTDGQLFRIDAVTGAETLASDLGAQLSVATNRGTYDSITNIPGTTLLAILRTDRNTATEKVGGGLTDVIDLFDFDSLTYQQAVYTTAGTGGIALTDGPSYNSVDGAFSTGPAIYVIASGGAFEVFDPFDPTFSNQAVISGGTPAAGSYVDITNVAGVEDALYAYLDRNGGVADQVYVLGLDGSVSLLSSVAGTGAVAITDTNSGGLMTVATGGANAYTTLDGNSIQLANIATAGGISSITNISPVPEPGSAAALLTLLTATLLGYRRRRRLAA